MADLTTLQSWLTEAQQALHNLMVGSRMQTLTSPNGDSVTFTPADIDDLRQYISELQLQISQQTTTVSVKAPITFRF